MISIFLFCDCSVSEEVEYGVCVCACSKIPKASLLWFYCAQLHSQVVEGNSIRSLLPHYILLRSDLRRRAHAAMWSMLDQVFNAKTFTSEYLWSNCYAKGVHVSKKSLQAAREIGECRGIDICPIPNVNTLAAAISHPEPMWQSSGNSAARTPTGCLCEALKYFTHTLTYRKMYRCCFNKHLAPQQIP